MTTRVVHVNDNVPDAVYIGRRNNRKRLPQSKWANPYMLRGRSRADAISLYGYDITFGHLKHLQADLHELAGKPLACHCRHDGEARTDDNACHGDVLVALIEELGLDEP